MIWLRSLLFTTLLFASILPWSFVVIASRIGGWQASYQMIATWARGVLWLCAALCGLRFRVEGRENVPVQSSVAMLKHSSVYETLAQMRIFPAQCWVLKRELTWLPFFGWALATVRPIAIDRGAGRQAVEQVVEQGVRRLEAGTWVMIFPEGTRTSPGETRRYGLSGVLLAQSARRMLVPVAHDAGDFWPRRGLRKRAGTVTIRIGKPVDPAGRDPRDVNAEIQLWIETQIAELRGTPPPATDAFRYPGSQPRERSAR